MVRVATPTESAQQSPTETRSPAGEEIDDNREYQVWCCRCCHVKRFIYLVIIVSFLTIAPSGFLAFIERGAIRYFYGANAVVALITAVCLSVAVCTKSPFLVIPSLIGEIVLVIAAYGFIIYMAETLNNKRNTEVSTTTTMAAPPSQLSSPMPTSTQSTENPETAEKYRGCYCNCCHVKGVIITIIVFCFLLSGGKTIEGVFLSNYLGDKITCWIESGLESTVAIILIVTFITRSPTICLVAFICQIILLTAGLAQMILLACYYFLKGIMHSNQGGLGAIVGGFEWIASAFVLFCGLLFTIWNVWIALVILKFRRYLKACRGMH